VYIELLRHVYGGWADEDETQSQYNGWMAPPVEEPSCFNDLDTEWLTDMLFRLEMNLTVWRELTDEEVDGNEEMRDWRVYEISF
jgi:hypothetical protein